MKKSLLFLLLLLTTAVFAQEKEHRWKPLVQNEKDKIWYDAAMMDTSKAEVINMWILQMHKPPLRFDEIDGEVYRSKTYYTINLKNAKYGIVKVVYYNSASKELANFTYDILSIPDEIKFSYPIMEGSFLHQLIKEYFKLRGQR